MSGQKTKAMERPGVGSVPDKVAYALREDIVSGRLKVGARLPTEHALCAQFGVSRPAIREAISRLRHDGLVESRRGAGAVVTETRRAFRIEPELIEDRQELAQIFELRITFETASAALAAVRSDTQSIERIREPLDQMARAIEADRDAVPFDTRFHLAIAEATGNRYFVEFMAFLEGRLRGSVRASRSGLRIDRGRARAVHAEHEAILRAIIAGDSEHARAAMLLHLKNAAEELGLSAVSPVPA